MEHLRNLMQQELPLNRKERFFTGTVFPMIVCRDNFEHFGELLHILGCDQIPVSANPLETNIQFFTEYSLVESITASSKKRFTKSLTSKDTPDILILLKTEENLKILIAIEAKMYDTPDALSLTSQMDNQSANILCHIQEDLNISIMYHYALLPSKLYQKLHRDGFNYQTITWEQLVDVYSEWYADDYFLSMLKIALESYDELVSTRNNYGKNCEEKLRGDEIYKRYKNSTLNRVIMGRYRGITGEYLNEDVKSGNWRKQLYETSSVSSLPNKNWFSIKDFVELIDLDILADSIAKDGSEE